MNDSWQIAFNRLTPDLKASLDIAVNLVERLYVLTAVLNEAEEKKKLCLQKRLKIRLHGQTIILRDVFDKIIAWVNEVKSIDDIAVQLNSTAASLPWAGVRFLLQFAVAEQHYFESTIHGLELVSLIISHYAAFEALHMRKASLINDTLQSKLTDLYTKILVFLANGVKYFNQSAAARMSKGVFQSKQSDELGQIAELGGEVGELARMYEARVQHEIHTGVEETRQILDTLQRPVNRLVDESAIYAKTLQEQQFHDFLKWLSPAPFTLHHARHSSERLPDSAKWLFNHPQYVSWKCSSSSSLLLLHGVPGSGKTSLASAVVDAFLEEKDKNPLAAPIAYFYCGDSKVGRGRADPDEVMRSLTRQLAVIDKTKHEIHEQISLEYERREAEAKLDGFEKVPRLRSLECVGLVLNALDSNPATIVVDGVDEVDQQERHSLLKSLIRVRDESSSVIKIFISSRTDSNIFAHLPDAISLRVQDIDTQHDMELFVRHRVSTAIENRHLLSGNVPQSLQDELVRFLLDRAGEMFLWVVLQLEILCKLKSRSSVLEAMQERSRVTDVTLDHLYCELIDRRSGTDSFAYDVSMRAFSWIMCMHEPLSSTAFLAAVSTSALEDRLDLTLQELLSMCSNLITLDSKVDTIRFRHSSFKEFLEARPEFDMARAHSVAAVSCLDSCIQEITTDLENELRPDKEFKLYATLYWPTHCSEAAVDEDQGSHLSMKLNEFVFSEGETSLPFIAWLNTAQRASNLMANDHVLKKQLNAVLSPTMTPLFTACVYGLISLLKVAVNKLDFVVDVKNSIGYTGLYLAAAFGRPKIVDGLLKSGADVKSQLGMHGNALNAAAFNGHTTVVQVLLHHGVGTQSPSIIEPALNLSFLAEREDIAMMLFQNGIRISCQEDYDKFHEAASQAGFYSLLQHLTKTFPSFGKDKLPSSKAINVSIRKGQLSFLKTHIKKGLLVDHAVATAALFGQTDIALFFLQEGFDIEEEGPFGSPLRTACLMGHQLMSRILLEQGANVNASGKFGDALQAAAMKGHLSITVLLIQHNTDVNSTGGYYGTALQAAAYCGHCAVTKTLIEAGSWDRRAFHAAAKAGQEAIIDIFLEMGYRFEQNAWVATEGYPIKSYKNLLLEALGDQSVSRGTRKVSSSTDSRLSQDFPLSDFQDILKGARGVIVSETHHSPPCNLQKDYPWLDSEESEASALELVAARGEERIVRKILESKRCLNVNIDEVGRALWVASKNGHTTVVKLIMSSGVDMLSYIPGSLEHAAWNGHITILETILKCEETWDPVGSSFFESYWTEKRSHNTIGFHQLFRTFYTPGSFSNPHALHIIIFGCGGNQPASVAKGLQLADDNDRQKLQGIVLRAAAMSNATNVIGYISSIQLTFDPVDLPLAFQAAAENGATSALACLVEKDQEEYLRIEHYRSAFTSAVTHGHAEVVRYMVDRATLFLSSENVRQSKYIERLSLLMVDGSISYSMVLRQAFEHACAAGYSEIAELFILGGANLNTSMDDGTYYSTLPKYELQIGLWKTPLQLCLHKSQPRTKDEVTGQEEIIKILLENNANVNLTAGYQATALHSAALKCTEGTVRLMLDHGANIHAWASKDGTPLQWAAGREAGSLPIVRLLLEAGAEIPMDGNPEGSSSPVLRAALSFFGLDSSDEQEIFSNKLNDGRFSESESLQEVLSSGPGGVIKLLFQYKPELQAQDERIGHVLQMAAAAGDGEFIQLLIDRNIDVNLSGHYFGNALQAASRFGHVDCVQLLLEAGADINMLRGSHGTPLQAAVKGAHLEVVRILINSGADPNRRLSLVPSQCGYEEKIAITSAIELAVESESVEIAELLINAGARIDPGSPVLHIAAKARGLSMLRLLIHAGAEVNSCVSGHDPVLITACGHGDVQMVELLLESGADINISRAMSQPSSDEARPKFWLKKFLQMPRENKGENFDTPLTRTDHVRAIEQSLWKGAAVHNPPRTRHILVEACHGQRPKQTIELLLAKLLGSSALTAAFEEALSAARQNHDEESFMLLLANLPKTVFTLYEACMLGSKDAVEAILASGVDVNSDFDNGGRALHIAAHYQRSALIPFLIQKGADVCHVSSGFGGAVSAALNGFLALKDQRFDGIISRQPTPSRRGPRNRLRKIASQEVDTESYNVVSCEETVGLLLRSGAVANLGPGALGPLLHLAARIGSLSLVQLFLQKGLDINTTEGPFGSALLAAILGNHEQVIKFLIAQGIDVNIVSPTSGTALYYACRGRDRWLMKTLLEHGADINARGGGTQESPLTAFLSFKRGCPEDLYGIEILLKYGDSLQITTEDLLSAVATYNDNRRSGRYVIERLLDHDKNMPVAEEVIAAARKSYREELVTMFLERGKKA